MKKLRAKRLNPGIPRFERVEKFLESKIGEGDGTREDEHCDWRRVIRNW